MQMLVIVEVSLQVRFRKYSIFVHAPTPLLLPVVVVIVIKKRALCLRVLLLIVETSASQLCLERIITCECVRRVRE